MKRLLLIALATLGAATVALNTAAGDPAQAPFRWHVQSGPHDLNNGYALATLGSDVILFGGGQKTGSTWRWDGNGWMPLTTAVSPPARKGHAMVTLGDKLFLFGGTDMSNQPNIYGVKLADSWQFDGTNWTQIYSPGASPPARSGHAMAALNGKVLLFGGEVDAPTFDDTWLWDGAVWKQYRSTEPGPPSRSGHAMATLGDRIVLFGGALFGTPLGDTWTWNGSGWTELTPPVSPSARSNTVMVTLGNRVVLLGGQGIIHSGLDGAIATTLDDFWDWDGTTWTERRPPTLPTPGAKVMAARGNELVVFSPPLRAECSGDSWSWNGAVWSRHPGPAVNPIAISGYVAAPLNDKAFLFGPACSGKKQDVWTWTEAGWTAVPTLSGPPARMRPAIATLGNKVLMFGGEMLQNKDQNDKYLPPDVPIPLGDTWMWDGNSWTDMQSLLTPSPRMEATMAANGTEVILFGGRSTDEVLNDTWRWDGTAWTQLTPKTSPSPRTAHAMAAMGNKIVLHGGLASNTNSLGDSWRWDGTDWTELAPSLAPSPRSGHALVPFKDGLLLAGGTGLYFGATLSKRQELDDLWTWDGGTWAELLPTSSSGTASGSRPIGRHDAALVALGDTLLLYGGTRTDDLSGQVDLNDTWTFASGAWAEQKAPNSTPRPRGGHAIAPAREGFMLFGGGDEGGTFTTNETWIWDGKSWSERRLQKAPPGRREHAMAALGDQVVLFGGADISGTLFDDTWLWDGEAWERANVSVAPSARMNHAMATLNGEIILFGGSDGLRVAEDTWAWNGKSWRKLESPTHPAGRFKHAMAPAGGELVLFGGTDLVDTPMDDMWTWDGKIWTEQSVVPVPSARLGHAMAGVGDGALLLGGISINGEVSDAWLWKGGRWKRLPPQLAPPPLTNPKMAARDGHLVVFGGDATADTWYAEYDDHPPDLGGDDGCACRSGRGNAAGATPAVIALAMLLAARRRRRA